MTKLNATIIKSITTWTRLTDQDIERLANEHPERLEKIGYHASMANANSNAANSGAFSGDFLDHIRSEMDTHAELAEGYARNAFNDESWK